MLERRRALPRPELAVIHIDLSSRARGRKASKCKAGLDRERPQLLRVEELHRTRDDLTRLNEAREPIPLVGGIAAGWGRPGAQALILEDAVHAEGAVGAVVSGLPVLIVVSQGCRPLGREAVITRCEGNVVYELAAEPALERLRRETPPSPPRSKRGA
jgi:small ligand-binding sensory domain FIST